jgi:tetratricopeptide (TPR) repeat protein
MNTGLERICLKASPRLLVCAILLFTGQLAVADELDEVLQTDVRDVGFSDLHDIVRVCSKALDAVPQDQIKLDRCYWQRAYAHWYLGNYEAAIGDFGWLVKKHPDDLDAVVHLIQGKINLGQVDSALGDLAPVVQKRSSSTLLALLASCHNSRNEEEQADAAAAKALKANPLDSMVWLAKAEIALSKGLFKDAVSNADKSIELSKSKRWDVSSEALILRAMCYQHLGDYNAALEDLRTVRSAGRHENVAAIRARCYIGLGKIAGAQRIAKTGQNYATVQVNRTGLLVLELLAGGKSNDAWAEIEKQSQDTGPSVMFAPAGAAALVLLKKPVDAARLLAKFGDGDPDRMATLCLILVACLRGDDNDKQALEMAQKASRTTSDTNPRHLIILSLVLAKNGMFAEAQNAAKKALERLPNDAPIKSEYLRILEMHKAKTLYRLDIKSQFALCLLF